MALRVKKFRELRRKVANHMADITVKPTEDGHSRQTDHSNAASLTHLCDLTDPGYMECISEVDDHPLRINRENAHSYVNNDDDNGELNVDESHGTPTEYMALENVELEPAEDVRDGSDSFISSSDDEANFGENVGNEPKKLSAELAEWAVEYNIRHQAINGLLKRLSRFDRTLPKDARTLFTRNAKVTDSIRPMRDMHGNGGEYIYFGMEKQLNQMLTNGLGNLIPDANIYLLFNVDGLPLYKSSSKQFWPILCKVEQNDEISSKNFPPFPVAIFCGNSKPENAEIFLHDLINELKSFHRSGLMHRNEKYNIHTKAFVCDAPARAFIKCIKGHTGFWGCEKCSLKGIYLKKEKKVIFREMNARKRTDEDFRSHMQPGHHKQSSPLLSLGIGLVSQVPLDYMHLICLGIMKRLLVYWLRGESKVRISIHQSQLISQELINMKPSICHEFQRTPRTLLEVDRWKAVEFRLFLLYTGPIALRDILPSKLYHHFMLLHVSISILINPELHRQHCDYAEQLLKEFVANMCKFYGFGSLVYNVHNLLHIVDDVRSLGALDAFSAFPFENLLGRMKRMLRSGNKPLAQLCHRIAERSSLSVASLLVLSPASLTLSRPHLRGPTLSRAGDQFDNLQFQGMRFSTNCRRKSDSYALLKNLQVVQIVNIVRTPSSTVFLLCNYFRSKQSFYDYPCDSNKLNVYKVSKLSIDMIEVEVHELHRKCMIFSRKDYFVLFPLLHCVA